MGGMLVKPHGGEERKERKQPPKKRETQNKMRRTLLRRLKVLQAFLECARWRAGKDGGGRAPLVPLGWQSKVKRKGSGEGRCA